MQVTSTTPFPWRLRGLALAGLLVLAACSSGGGSDAAKATTTTAKSKATPTTEAKGDSGKADDPVGEDSEGAMPTKESDAPEGDWVGVRWMVSQEPEPENFTPGQADVRLYSIEPSCDDDGCALTLNPGGDDDSYALPDLEPLTGPPVELEADDEAWTAVEPEESYGCTDELTGDFIDSESSRSLKPLRNDDGEIIALAGTVTFTDELNADGEEAGCPEDSGTVDEYQTVMVPVETLGEAPTFDVDSDFRQSLEVSESSGYTESFLQKGGISVSLEGHDLQIDGSCDDGDCSVSVSQVITEDMTRTYELEGSEEDGMSGKFSGTGGCFDPETGDQVMADGAYDETLEVTQLVPVLVLDGDAKIFLGRYESTSEPTAEGKTEEACSTPQSLAGWVTWVDKDLFEG